jgi:hypothetical protein
MQLRVIIDDLPDAFCDLQILNILRQIIQPTEQAERVSPGRERGDPNIRSNTQPFLLPYLYGNTVFNFLNRNRERSLPAGRRTLAGRDLYHYLLIVPELPGDQITPVEMGDQRPAYLGRR